MDSLIQPHVLVLDPDPASRVVLTAVLQHNGLRVTACDSESHAARYCLRRHRYAVIILSADLPDFATLVRAIGAPPAAERPKIIVAATSPLPAIPEADAVLLKPFDLDAMYGTIAQCCSVCGDDRQRRAERAFETATEVQA
jgi:CheY-like chemotaxis protein